MPIYEYGCTKCGFELEKLQKLNDPPLTDCPACSKAALRKKVSAAGFRLKGSGWYETDFKKGSKRNLHDSGDGKPAADSAKSSPKKEAASTSTPSAKSD
jgi:putative FmdB family regulatory protein